MKNWRNTEPIADIPEPKPKQPEKKAVRFTKATKNQSPSPKAEQETKSKEEKKTDEANSAQEG